jgi:hypothetical protein
MLSTLLSRATRVVQEITRLGMDMQGLTVGGKLFEVGGRAPDYTFQFTPTPENHQNVQIEIITINGFNVSGTERIYMIERNGNQYVTTKKLNRHTHFGPNMRLNVFPPNDNIMVLVDREFSFIFYKNIIQPPKFDTSPLHVYHVPCEHRYGIHKDYDLRVWMEYGWPKEGEHEWIKGLTLTVREYERNGTYFYCLDRDGDEYVAKAGKKVNIVDGIKWKISHASMHKVTFYEDEDSIRIQRGIQWEPSLKIKRNFDTITFHLDHWSGKGFDAGKPPLDSFDVSDKGPVEVSKHGPDSAYEEWKKASEIIYGVDGLACGFGVGDIDETPLVLCIKSVTEYNRSSVRKDVDLCQLVGTS